jgi:hypothetical protein
MIGSLPIGSHSVRDVGRRPQFAAKDQPGQLPIALFFRRFDTGSAPA